MSIPSLSSQCFFSQQMLDYHEKKLHARLTFFLKGHLKNCQDCSKELQSIRLFQDRIHEAIPAIDMEQDDWRDMAHELTEIKDFIYKKYRKKETFFFFWRRQKR